MGKSLPSPHRIQDFARIISSNRIQGPTQVKPASRIRSVPSPVTAKFRAVVDGQSSERRLKLKQNMEEASSNSNSNTSSSNQRRLPLADVVADCVKRWFQDTLKEAKAGDSSMQVLVGQMYFSGYGISRDAQKVLIFFFLLFHLFLELIYLKLLIEILVFHRQDMIKENPHKPYC